MPISDETLLKAARDTAANVYPEKSLAEGARLILERCASYEVVGFNQETRQRLLRLAEGLNE